LSDEIGHLGGVESHELVDGVLGVLAVVGSVGVTCSLLGAAEESTEVLVQVLEKTPELNVSMSESFDGSNYEGVSLRVRKG